MLLLACSSSSDGGHPIHRLFIILAGKERDGEKWRLPSPNPTAVACCVGIHPCTFFRVPPFFSPRDPGRARSVLFVTYESL